MESRENRSRKTVRFKKQTGPKSQNHHLTTYVTQPASRSQAAAASWLAAGKDSARTDQYNIKGSAILVWWRRFFGLVSFTPGKTRGLLRIQPACQSLCHCQTHMHCAPLPDSRGPGYRYTMTVYISTQLLFLSVRVGYALAVSFAGASIRGPQQFQLKAGPCTFLVQSRNPAHSSCFVIASIQKVPRAEPSIRQLNSSQENGVFKCQLCTRFTSCHWTFLSTGYDQVLKFIGQQAPGNFRGIIIIRKAIIQPSYPTNLLTYPTWLLRLLVSIFDPMMNI